MATLHNVSKTAHRPYATFRFHPHLKEIYFRIDTEDTYKIMLIPTSMASNNFPQRSIVISSPSTETPVCICSVKPGECVKLTKVNDKKTFLINPLPQ
jgi:hypothetical protein